MNDIKEIMANAFICADYRCYEGFDYVSECMVEVIDKLKLEGFVYAPKEPNRKMLELYVKALSSDMPFSQFYKAMIEASQGGDV